jgi:hypothetical protein
MMAQTLLHVRGLAKRREEFIDVVRHLTRQRCEEELSTRLRRHNTLAVAASPEGW